MRISGVTLGCICLAIPSKDKGLIDEGIVQINFIVPKMDKMADGEDKQDKGSKNKRKLTHPSILPANFLSALIDFPRYELQNSQNSLNEFISSKLGSDWCREEEPEMHMHELVDWNDPIANQLEELLLSNLQVIFRGAVKQIVELGYNEKLAEMSILRKALYIEEGNPISNIANETLNVLTGKDDTNMDFIFENFQHLLHYTIVEMISILREVKPSLTVGEAMWLLLISDLNLALACVVSCGVCDGESSTCSSIPQSKSKVQSSLASGKLKHKAKDASLPITTVKSSGTSEPLAQECHSGCCSKRHKRKEIATLRQKLFHLEKTYRAYGKGGFISGKITSVGGLVVEKRLKPPSEISNQQMKCGSSNTISTKGICTNDVACHVSTNDVSVLPTGSSSGALPIKDTIFASPMVTANTSTPGNTPKPTLELSSSNIPKIIDYCVGIPSDEALGKHVPRDEKVGLILKLISRVQELQDELQSWNNWTNQKVMQVTDRLGTLRKEKQGVELIKKDKKNLEENATKRISEMENAVENNKRQIESTTSAILMLQAENSLVKKELDAAKLWIVKSMTSLQEALEREQMTLKQAQSWESQKKLLRDELEREKHKLSTLQQELNKEKNLQAQVESHYNLMQPYWTYIGTLNTQGRLAKERVAKEKLIAQATSIKKEREQLKAQMKSEEDMIRKKAASDLHKYVQDIAKLEKELGNLTLKFDSEKIAKLLRCVDKRNNRFSRTSKSTPNMKENRKSDMSQTMISNQDKFKAESLRREQECVMCLSEEMSVVFLPCAHQVVCSKCNELHEKQGMKDCPSCRTLIQRRIHARFVGH
ncbi:hypothetical protein VNO77_14100 [Canavalia gladiata]|uniref:RING-type domain-containing protein n=1 Tax=Canavalia gladiata TaxID=3824 RepID=A0AAN9QNK5_CANGL